MTMKFYQTIPLKKLAFAALAASALVAQVRFDQVVRNDMFAGFNGNVEALTRGMETCEKILAQNPNDAEAMVWHGMGTFVLAGAEFQSGNQKEGNLLMGKGLAEMKRAVELEPDNIGVRIPRGAILMQATRQMQDSPFRQGLLESARSDFQHAFDAQRDHLNSLGTHPLGELLQGLGDIYSRQGKPDEAQKYFAMIRSMLKSTEYDTRAAAWLKTRQPLPAAQTGCVGCHVSK
jgi:tetratricopeptide (TPR) repeat protein